MPNNDQDQQAAFIGMLQEGYVLTAEDVIGKFRVRNAGKYVTQVMKRTGLDIYHGKITVNGGVKTVYYMTSDIKPECPGFNEMSSLVEYQIDEEVHAYVEYQKGYYLMWTCYHVPDLYEGQTEPNDDSYCGQYHKVDLGDEPLTETRTVQCIKCGNQYQVQPKPNYPYDWEGH